MSKLGYIMQPTDSSQIDNHVEWMKNYGCNAIMIEDPQAKPARMIWKNILPQLRRNDELVIVKISDIIKTQRELTYFFELSFKEEIRIISIEDKLDTKDEIFPRLSTVEILHLILSSSRDGIYNSYVPISSSANTSPLIHTEHLRKSERDQLIIQMYLEHRTIREIKDLMHISRQTIYDILKQNRISLHHEIARVDTKERDQMVIQMYLEHHPISEINDILHIGKRTIYRILKQNHINLHQSKESINIPT